MAEYIGSGEVEVHKTVRVLLDFEEYYLSEDAARELRDSLNTILDGDE